MQTLSALPQRDTTNMLHELPHELLILILEHSRSAGDVARIGLASFSLHRVISDHSVWRTVAMARLRALGLDKNKAISRWLPVVVEQKGWIWLCRALDHRPHDPTAPPDRIVIGRSQDHRGRTIIGEHAMSTGKPLGYALALIPEERSNANSWYVGGWTDLGGDGVALCGNATSTATGTFRQGLLEGPYTVSACVCPSPSLHPAAVSQYGYVQASRCRQGVIIGETVHTFCNGNRLEVDYPDQPHLPAIDRNVRFFGGPCYPDLVISGVAWTYVDEKGLSWMYPDPTASPAEFCRFRSCILENLHTACDPSAIAVARKVMDDAMQMLPPDFDQTQNISA